MSSNIPIHVFATWICSVAYLPKFISKLHTGAFIEYFKTCIYKFQICANCSSIKEQYHYISAGPNSQLLRIFLGTGKTMVSYTEAPKR